MASIIFCKTTGQSSVCINIMFQNKLSIRNKLTTYFLRNLEMQTLFVKGEVGISIFREQLLGKTPFSISLIAAFIKGKQTETASLKSVS
jgi:hypothetical protein